MASEAFYQKNRLYLYTSPPTIISPTHTTYFTVKSLQSPQLTQKGAIKKHC